MDSALIRINSIKINSIQSGGSFVVGEHIINIPTSKMVMMAGPGSMNNGDEEKIHCSGETKNSPKI